MPTKGRGRVRKEDHEEHFRTKWARPDTDGSVADESKPDLVRALSEACYSVEHGFALPEPLTKALLVYLRKRDRQRTDLAIFNEVITAAREGNPASKGSKTGDTAFEMVAKKFHRGTDNVQRIYNKVRKRTG